MDDPGPLVVVTLTGGRPLGTSATAHEPRLGMLVSSICVLAALLTLRHSMVILGVFIFETRPCPHRPPAPVGRRITSNTGWE